MQKNAENLEPVTEKNYFFVISSLIISLGILTVTIGGSWDISNHLLNKPETFFSPPHALLYGGVAIALVGTVMLFFSWCKIDQKLKKLYVFPLRLSIAGIMVLVGAGPFDFLWHSAFGLDGLLSPSHITLASGMVLCSIGALIIFVRHQIKNLSLKSYTPSNFLLAACMLPTLISLSGIFYSFSLPFSETEYFDFNPEPYSGAILATLAFPFLFTVILSLSSSIVSKKFGMVTLVGAIYLAINASTLIIPNQSLISTLPFYFTGIIPIVIFDLVVSNTGKKILHYCAGGLVGSSFYFIFYPLITYTYNEVFLHQLVWPSITSQIYFELLHFVYPVVVAPAILMGTLGVVFSDKIMPKIRQNLTV